MVENAPSPGTPSRRRYRPSEADIVMALMNKAIDVSRLQFKRVRSDLDDYHQLVTSDGSVRVFSGESHPENMSKSREIRTALFADVHFLLISLHETEKLLSKLKSLFPQEADLANLRNKYRPLMRRCADFRAQMEHIDGKDTDELGSLVDMCFSLKGEKLDLGPDFERNAEGLFCDLISVWARMSERQSKIRELISRTHVAS